MKKGVVLYVCSMCGGLGMINDSTWEETSRGRALSAPEATSSGVQTLDPCYGGIESWDHYPEFEQLIRGTQDESIPNFPLCDQCAELATEHALRMNDLVRQFVDDVNEIDRYGEEFTSRILSREEFLSPFKVKERTPIPSQGRRTSDAGFEFFQSVDSSVPGIEPVRRSITPRFAQIAAFKFNIDGQFGTINGQRLGTLKCSQVPVQELQNALHVLCRFLVYQMRVVGLDPMNIKVGATIQFVSPEGVKVLKVPEKSREINAFNEALTLMMCGFNAVFNSKFLEKMRPAHLIDTEKQTIGGESYSWTKGSQENFTAAMRKLVVNLKTIQAYETIFALPNV